MHSSRSTRSSRTRLAAGRVVTLASLFTLCAAVVLSAMPLAHSAASAGPAPERAQAHLGGGLRPATRPVPDAQAGPLAPMPPAKGADFISYALPDEPAVLRAARRQAGPGASRADVEAEAQQFMRRWSASAYHGPDPVKHSRLLLRERASTAGARLQSAQAVTGTLRLLVVAVEFAGTDSVDNFSHPATVFESRTCVTETVTYQGPLHNQIPQPSRRDNNTYWLPSFERDYYEKLVFSEEGVTERPRMDLIDPRDGRPGIDIRGLSMARLFDEMSAGRVRFDGGPAGVVAWVQVPHSVAYYAANACINNNPGAIQRMNGLPTNPRFPRGVGTLLEDIARSINQQQPDFPWADYDTDGDRIVDHVVMVFAGQSRSSGGGQWGFQQIWAHRSSVDAQQGGLTVDDAGTPENRGDDIRIIGYTAQPENLYLGVLAHEFGHDIGLPDLYDISGLGRSGVEWWDLMSNGGQTGRLVGSDPTHLSAWSKIALGWSEPYVVTPTNEPQTVVLGQTSRPPRGAHQAVRINLPPSNVPVLQPPQGSTQMWWSNNDQNLADVRLTREVNLRNVTAPISLTFHINHSIEADWDYMFVEVSVDGGQTFTQTKGFRVDTGQEVTTPDGYTDPNGALAAFGGLRYGYTGNSQGWRRVFHDLSAYAGQAVQVRLRYVTDDGTLLRGAFADNFRILAGANVILDDPVEDDNFKGWQPSVHSFRGARLGSGWRLSDGTVEYPRYYLLEWRNFDGFDEGLRYTYQTVFSRLTEDGREEWHVDKLPSAVPGMLVWLRDTRYGQEPTGANNSVLSDSQFFSTPSEGPKGGALIVDSHPDPLRGPLGGRFTNQFGTWPFPPSDNWTGRVQATNAPFGLLDTPAITLTVASGEESPETTIMTPTRYAGLPPVPGFHDALGYFPGVERLPQPITVVSNATNQRIKPYAFVDPDASVVVPARAYYPPRTPPGFTGQGAETSPPSADISSDETMFLRGVNTAFANIGAVGGLNITGEHTGNPGDYDLHFGFHAKVIDQAADGSAGTLETWRQADAAEVQGTLESAARPDDLAVSAALLNVGGAYTLTLYSDFDEGSALYVEGSATGGAVPLAVGPAAVQAAVRARGMAGLLDLAVPAQRAVGVAWAGKVGSGQWMDFTYDLRPKAGALSVTIINAAYGPSSDTRALDRLTLTRALRPAIFMPFTQRQRARS